MNGLQTWDFRPQTSDLQTFRPSDLRPSDKKKY